MNCRPASLALLLDCIMSKFPAAPKPLAQPSTRRFHVFEAAGFVQESSQRSSNLSWFDQVQFACESTQSKFEPRIYEGKSLFSIMPSVSKVVKVSDSPCQGRELEVNSQVYDLMSSKPSDTRSVPMSVRDAAVLERTLRGALESYNFQLGTMMALFHFSGDSGQIPLDDPLLDQFQRSFSRGTENVAAALSSDVAFVTTKRREFFLSHMVPSVTEAQKRNPLSDPAFQEAGRHAARDVSLYKGAWPRPSTSSGTTQRRPFSSSSASRGRTRFSSASATPQRSQASSSSKRFSPQKKSSDPLRGFSGVGVCPLAQHRRLSGPLLASMEGSGSGCLGRGVLARVPSSTPQASHSTGSSGSRLLQSPICGPIGFRGVAPYRRPIHPEHLHRIPAISHGDSSVRPSLHPPRRLGARSPLSVQGAVLRANNCPSGLYMADGSTIRHSPSLQYPDARMPRRLADSSRIQDHLSTGGGRAPASVRGAGTTSHSQEVVLDSISGHDLSRHADPISLVHCKTDSDKGSESPQDHRGAFFHPRPPQQLYGVVFWATFRPLLFW